ncbi:YCF48-related protein [Inhella proteolytica]|uniref:PKD domain-containing protein n=1 Tax=Inhella proteolytica TaxID=2795029 RepID=A0A931J4T1_9BURK|nr:YCF48-related protein [Inhella proteolytica]MBH9578738.1 PKD domain-containing protein [Inhella proteolytica]
MASIRQRLWLALASLCAGLIACGGGSRAPAPTPLPDTLSLQAPQRAEAGERITLQLSGLAGAANAQDLSWDWQFGDSGTSSSPVQVEHPFAQPGQYEVRLTLRNGAGQQRTLQTRVEVGHFQRLIGRDCSQTDSRGWCWQMPTRAVHEIHDIHFAESGWGLAVGATGQLSRSEDGGRSWVVLPSPTSAALRWVRAGANDTAFAVTEDLRLLASEDRGMHWLDRGRLPLGRLGDLWLHGPRTLIASGTAEGPFAFLQVAVSTDGGSNWRSVSAFASAVGQGGQIWDRYWQAVSLDLGQTWHGPGNFDTPVLALASSGALRVDRITSDRGQTGLQALRHGRSEDGGLQFSSAPIEWPPELPADSLLKALRLGPGGQGIALFESGGYFSAAGQELTRLVLSSRDGGASWQPVGAPLADQLNQFWEHEPLLDSGAVQFVQAGTTMLWDTRNTAAVAVQVPGEPGRPQTLRRSGADTLLAGFGEGRAWRWYSSADLGRTWQPLPGSAGAEDEHRRIDGLGFFDAQSGLMLKSDGSVWRSEDGGRSWAWATVLGPATRTFSQLQLRKSGEAWALAEGRIFRSQDRGLHWQELGSPGEVVSVLRVLDDSAAFKLTVNCPGLSSFCSNSLHQSADGGRTWQALPAFGNMVDFDFANARQGVALTQAGELLHSQDGGQHWEKAPAEAGLERGRVRFDRLGRAWALPALGQPRVLRSVDQGRSWTTIALPAQPEPLTRTTGLLDIAFGDAQTGWISGERGLLFSTQDGGQTWQRQQSGSERRLATLFALDAQTVWIAGGAPETLLSTATGGR